MHNEFEPTAYKFALLCNITFASVIRPLGKFTNSNARTWVLVSIASFYELNGIHGHEDMIFTKADWNKRSDRCISN